MNILIYGAASHNRSPDQQAQAELLLSQKHNVKLLTLGEDHIQHRNFRALGAEAYSSAHIKGRSFIYILRQSFYFAKFCKKHKIDVAFCHLQGNALIACLAQYFIKTRIIYVRHHTDEVKVTGSKKELLIGMIANALSPRIIAISEKVKQELLLEKVKQEKIYRINLCYNFDQIVHSELREDPAGIRMKMNSPFVILCIGRLFKIKRHLLLFEVVKQLNQKGHYCSLLCIGTGPMLQELENWIIENKMDDKIKLDGFRTNVADYIEAADILVQLAYSEASNQVVKEAGSLRKPSIVCNDVGDYNDYIKNNINGFLVDKEDPIPETVELLGQLINDRERIKRTGENIYDTILALFSIEAVKKDYEKLLSQK